MRRQLFVLALLLLAGGFAAWRLQDGEGYILIAAGGYTIEMSLWFGVLLLALVWLLWSLLWTLLARLFGPERGLVPTWRRASQRRLRLRREAGLRELLEGRWQRAQKLLERTGRKSREPLLDWLASATAALEEGDCTRARGLLANAAAEDPEAFGVKLLEAKLLLREQRDAEAAVLLEALRSREPGHHEVLRLLVATYRQQGDWRALEKLLPALKRHDACSTAELKALSRTVYRALLEQAATDEEPGLVVPRDRVLAVWDRMPASFRRDSAMTAVLVRQLHRIGEAPLAESQLRQALKQHWDPELVELYGIIEHRNLADALAVAEKWLAHRRHDPALLLTLGRLCLRAQLWGKARDYLEEALQLAPNSAVYAELAALAGQLGELERSAEYYRLGLEAHGGAAPVTPSG